MWIKNLSPPWMLLLLFTEAITAAPVLSGQPNEVTTHSSPPHSPLHYMINNQSRSPTAGGSRASRSPSRFPSRSHSDSDSGSDSGSGSEAFVDDLGLKLPEYDEEQQRQYYDELWAWAMQKRRENSHMYQ